MSDTSRSRLLAAASSAAVLALLAGCGSEGAGSTTDAGEDPSTSAGSAGQIAVTMANDGSGDTCAIDHDSVAAGPVTFTVTNQSATGLTEVELLSDLRILGEKENVVPGLAPGTFTVTLGGGTYEIYCPGAVEEKIPFTVTGEASASATGGPAEVLAQGANDYGTYVEKQVSSMTQGVRDLEAAVDSGDLGAAQRAYATARVFYERIESDVEGFVLDGFDPTDNHGNLDYLIDMRGSNLDPAVGWHGFHAVERDLFGRQRITASTERLAAELTANVIRLSRVAATLTFRPEDLANGAASLLEEVQANKISGEEEAFSHIDLVDFAGNVEGAQECFAYLQPGLEEVDAALTETIIGRFQDVTDLLDTYRDPASLGGYRRYTPQLRATDANTLSQTVQALQDALSRLAEKVATA